MCQNFKRYIDKLPVMFKFYLIFFAIKFIFILKLTLPIFIKTEEIYFIKLIWYEPLNHQV